MIANDQRRRVENVVFSLLQTGFRSREFPYFLNMPYFLSHRKEFTSGGCKWTEGITVSPFLANGRKPEPKKPEPKEERKKERKKEKKRTRLE